MKAKTLGAMSLTCLIVTVLWLVLYIYSVASAGPLETLEQALASVARPDALFYLTYANATLVTLSATMLFAGLYVYCQPTAPGWSAMGLVFVPVYCVLNLFAYLSQITIVPRLLALQQTAEYQAASRLLLGQMVQQWPGSAVNVLNNLAYAILGIPSIVFGVLLCRRGSSTRLPGVLLALNGVACIIGMAGVVSGSGLLQQGSIVGGALFLLALIPLSLTFLREA
jgi:hypothetical protein